MAVDWMGNNVAFVGCEERVAGSGKPAVIVGGEQLSEGEETRIRDGQILVRVGDHRRNSST